MAFSRNRNPYAETWTRPLPSTIPKEIMESGSNLDRACEKAMPLLDAHAKDAELLAAFTSEGFSEQAARWILPYVRRFGTADRLRDAIIAPPWQDYDPTSAFHSLLWWCVKPWKGNAWLAIPALVIAILVAVLAVYAFGAPEPFGLHSVALVGILAGTATLLVEGFLFRLIHRLVTKSRLQ